MAEHRSVEEVWIHALGARAGGGLTYLREAVPRLVARLEEAGVRPRVLLGDRDVAPFLDDGIVESVPRWAVAGPFGRLRYDQSVLPRLLAGRPAALFASGNFSPTSPTCRTVVLIRNTVYFDDAYLRMETRRRRILRRAQRRLVVRGAEAADAVHVPSAFMGDLLREHAPGIRALRVNPYGVRDGWMGAAPAARTLEGERPGPRRFLYVMNWTVQKNLGYLLRALVRAKEEGLPVQVVVTSSLERGPAACFRRDRALVDDHDLVGSGHLVPAGPTNGEALRALYDSVDACVFPSITEAFGNPLVEAMALGLPVVALDRPYAREICGPHALYCDAGHPGALTALWRDWPAVLGNWVPPDRDRLAARYSWDRHVDGLVEDLLPRADRR